MSLHETCHFKSWLDDILTYQIHIELGYNVIAHWKYLCPVSQDPKDGRVSFKQYSQNTKIIQHIYSEKKKKKQKSTEGFYTSDSQIS